MEDGFATGVQWVLTALLQSPHFHAPSSGRSSMMACLPVPLGTRDPALLPGGRSAPDDELLAAAGSGGLTRPPGWPSSSIGSGPPSSPSTTSSRSCGLAAVGATSLRPSGRGELSVPDRGAARRDDRRERAAMAEVYREGGGLTELLQAEHSWMTDELAAYGLAVGRVRPTPRATVGWSGLPPRRPQPRLAARTRTLPTGNSRSTAGVRAGAPPLPGAHLRPPTSTPPVGRSEPEHARAPRPSSQPACAGCHELIDPIGFAFEHFDGSGRWRSTDGPHPVDDTGYIASAGDSEGDFAGVDGLAAQLMDSEDLSSCYAQQWLRYGTGLDETGSLARSVAPLADAIRGATARGHL